MAIDDRFDECLPRTFTGMAAPRLEVVPECWTTSVLRFRSNKNDIFQSAEYSRNRFGENVHAELAKKQALLHKYNGEGRSTAWLETEIQCLRQGFRSGR